MVHKYPHEVTIYEGGPMTNLALALRIDPQFAELAQETRLYGRQPESRHRHPEFVNTPRHEFNFWMDPEAADACFTRIGEKLPARRWTFRSKRG